MESSDINALPSALHTSTACQTAKSFKKAQLRGLTRKLLVELWSSGKIIGANARQFKTAIGEAVRLHVSLSTIDYRKLKGNFKEDIWINLTEQVKEVKRTRIANGEGSTNEEDISQDALAEVFGKEKKNRVRGVGSNITRKQLEHAAVANVLLNQISTSSSAAVHADVAKFTSKFDTDLSDVKSLLMVLIQQGQDNTVTSNGESFKGVGTPRTEVGSSFAQCLSRVTPPNLTPFGSLDQRRVTLLDKFGKEVAKGFVDNTTGTVCHGRAIYVGEKKVYIDEVLVPDVAVYDDPHDGNSTLNAWLEGGYIVWLDGRLKYE